MSRLGRAALQAATLPRIVVNAHVHPRLRRTPLVSVLIPTFNRSNVLRHAIRSALWQTYPSLEVIVVGDACTDDSEAVVRSFGDDRIRWENLERNSGSQAFPNNRGLELARGKYVAYLGHDDLWLPTHLTHGVAALERSRHGLAAAMIQSLGPPGSNVRLISGLRARAPSGVVHRRDVVDTTGGWRDYRTLVEPPDREFIDRVVARHGIEHTHALTVIKFNAGWRRDSYRTGRDDEQRSYTERIARERAFVERELLAYLWLRLRRPPTSLPAFDVPAPAVLPPGWHMRQYRRLRGLPEEPVEPNRP